VTAISEERGNDLLCQLIPGSSGGGKERKIRKRSTRRKEDFGSGQGVGARRNERLKPSFSEGGVIAAMIRKRGKVKHLRPENGTKDGAGGTQWGNGSKMGLRGGGGVGVLDLEEATTSSSKVKEGKDSLHEVTEVDGKGLVNWGLRGPGCLRLAYQ